MDRTVLNNVTCQSAERVQFNRGNAKHMSIVCPDAQMCFLTDTFAYNPNVRSSPRKADVVGYTGLLQVKPTASVLLAAFDKCVIEKGADLGTLSTIIDCTLADNEGRERQEFLVESSQEIDSWDLSKLEQEIDLTNIDVVTKE